MKNTLFEKITKNDGKNYATKFDEYAKEHSSIEDKLEFISCLDDVVAVAIGDTPLLDCSYEMKENLSSFFMNFIENYFDELQTPIVNKWGGTYPFVLSSGYMMYDHLTSLKEEKELKDLNPEVRNEAILLIQKLLDRKNDKHIFVTINNIDGTFIDDKIFLASSTDTTPDMCTHLLYDISLAIISNGAVTVREYCDDTWNIYSFVVTSDKKIVPVSSNAVEYFYNHDEDGNTLKKKENIIYTQLV